MLKLRFLIIALLVLSMFTACSQRNGPQGNNPPSSQNQNPQEGGAATQPESYPSIPNAERKTHNTLSIAMPNDWREIASGATLLYLPKDSEAADPLSEKIIVMVSFKTQEEANMPLRERVDRGIESMKPMFPDVQLTSVDETATLAGLSAIRFNFTASIQGKKIQYTQISARKDLVVYGITHSCVENKCNYTGIYNDMVSSFRPLDFKAPN